MNINGVQKLTLLDYPGKTACTVFLAACNFRCPFCHNSTLVLEPGSQPEITQEQFFAFLERRKGLLDGVCITGGEPTLRRELPDFMAGIKRIGCSVKLDTNGTNPAMVRSLLEKGLVDYVAMDIKTAFADYPMLTGIRDFDTAPIAETMAVLRCYPGQYEFRTTVVAGLHTKESVLAVAEMVKDDPWFIQQFKDSGAIIQPGLAPMSRDDILSLTEQAKKLCPAVSLRGID